MIVLLFNSLLNTHFKGSNARRQWPLGTLHGNVDLESISQRVGECTNTGDDERLYNHTPSDSRLNVTPVKIKI